MSDKDSVLVVDDGVANIRILAEILSDEHDIIVATSGKQALGIAKEQKIHLILLDIMMPEMDGYEVCKILKSADETKNIPIIFVTALHGHDDELKGLELGAVDFITKPFSPAIVKARVKTHLKLYKQSLELESLARIDGLTGIPNRREYDFQLKKEWNRSIRHNHPISMLMIDIDYFKNYNDNYGHGKGDEALRKISATLLAVAKRAGDFVARYGGEEFVVLLSNTQQEGAILIAQEMLQAIRDLSIVHEFSLVNKIITLSIGIACANPTNAQSCHILEKHADDALYMAKNSKRDCYYLYSDIDHN